MRILRRSWIKLAISRGAAIGSVLFSLGAVNCSSDASSTPSSGGTGGAPTGGAPTGSAGSQTANAGSGQSGQSTAGGSDAGGGASEACTKYCNCYQTKCAGFVAVPGGMTCPAFCETFVNQKTFFDCRQSMCDQSGGPAANNNDHCSHMLGIGQCN